MELKDIMELQKKFDDEHRGLFRWSEHISQDNLGMLEFLIISLVGEIGELAGETKKVLRGDSPLESSRLRIEEECADVFIYLIKLCNQLDVDLEKAFLNKLEKNKIRFKQYEKC